MNRRGFIQISAIAAGLMSMAMVPIRALAAPDWNKSAFDDEDVNTALNDLYSTASHEPSDKITFKTPEIAENGAAVPVKVATSLDKVDSIALFSSVNQRPLVTYFTLSEVAVPVISTRVKLGKTGNVTAVVRSNGKLYSATNEVKVTIGGCGG